MAHVRTLAASALFVLFVIPTAVFAQVTLTPASPRWGDAIGITADPSVSTGADRFYKTDQLYAVLYQHRQGRTGIRDRVWVPMTWNGRQFVAAMTLPAGCEAGYVGVYSAEHYFPTLRRSFVCRKPDGTLPPGALITGLLWADRDTSNWKKDVADDLAAMRHASGRGWEYRAMWLFAWSRDKTPAAERAAQVERVEREEAADAPPELLSSIAAGYFGAGDVRRGFERLRVLCERFPHTEHTVIYGVNAASQAVVNNPEFDAELSELVGRVARAAPENKGLRDFLTRLVTKSPNVPLTTIRTIVERWVADFPKSAEPHYLLAVALAERADSTAEAETALSQAIELFLQPHPLDSAERYQQQRAFRLRSKLRAERNDLAGAIADARMAQVVAEDKLGADDMSVEADLWQRVGYRDKAEKLAIDAYHLGSLTAEGVLKNAYVARQGSDAGFGEYLIEQLRAANPASGRSLRPVPTVSATTLDGARIDGAALRGKVTVLDFWFTTCPPCAAERPKLNDIVAEFGTRARFIGFALDSPERLKTYLKATPFNYEIVPESESIARDFGIRAYPTHMIIDPAGNIVWISGTDGDRIERLRAMIYRMLAR